MILLDTHIWVWWVDGSPQFTARYQNWIDEHKADGLGVSVISCWEVAKLVENGRLKLQGPVEEWVEQALGYPSVQLLQLTPHIAVASTQLPGSFHQDPADQIIVATARIWDCPLLTADERILKYPHVTLLK